MASSRRAHQVLAMGLPSVGEWAATSPHTITCVKPKHIEGGRATSFICGLPPQGCATSPRGAHLLIPMCQNLLRSQLNHLPIK
jgi:hypothetical protein